MKLVWLLMIVLVQKSLQNDVCMIPVAVRRGLTHDIEYNGVRHNACNEGSNITYSVGERQCISDHDLLKECSSAIIPTDPTNLIAVARSTSSSIVTLKLANGSAIFHFQDMNKTINNSDCHVASLEVYRGKTQAIKISHEGFSLSELATIEINYNETTYASHEYEGELYRMKLSCSGEGLPESGCLFFKVFGNTTITNAKFNCTVPGTLADFDEECNNTRTTSTIPTTSPTTTSPTTILSMTTVSLSPTTGFGLGDTEFLVVVVCGVVVVTLLVAIVLMCFMVCLLRRKTRPSSAQTAPLREDDCKEELNLQDLDRKPDERYHTPTTQEYETVSNAISNGVQMTGGEDHVYAALETPKYPRRNTDPIKSNPNKMNKHANNSVQQKVHLEQVPPEAQYESPNNITIENSDKPQLAEGVPDDVSDHKYAVLERQPLTQKQLLQGGEVHHYDGPPREDGSNRPHPSDKQYGDDDPSNHMYAILEKL